MVDDIDLRQQVLQNTLEEVTLRRGEGASLVSDPCVICLEQVSEKAVAQPCNHDSFDFLCLVSWLQERPACPLCKAEVNSVSYDLQSSTGPKIYRLDSSPSKVESRTNPAPSRRTYQGRSGDLPRRRYEPPSAPSDALVRRRYIYRHDLYSLHVGSNRLSRFRELTPREFSSDEELISRARKWIRRELQVFDFLNSDSSSGDTAAERPQRRANNAEFLLEYIIAILKTIDIKGSGGQAEELIQDFLGRQSTRLFLHELQAWLRSPYDSLENWDRAVQYDETLPKRMSSDEPPRERTTDQGRLATQRHRSLPTDDRGARGGIRKPINSGSHWRRDSGGQRNFSRRLEAAQRRYLPD